eukprot:7701108-Pyramimonas_sp.AAC.1
MLIQRRLHGALLLAMEAPSARGSTYAKSLSRSSDTVVMRQALLSGHVQAMALGGLSFPTLLLWVLVLNRALLA